MKNTDPNLAFRGLIALLIGLLGGCNWVDSAGGAGSVSTSTEPVTTVEIFQDDQPVEGLLPDNVIVLPETANRTIATTAQATPGALVFRWEADSTEQGNLPACSDVGGFNSELAEATLSQACTDPESCQLRFERSSAESQRAEFEITVPVLKASVGLRYQLEVEDEAGRITRSDYDFCLIAINESPVAIDDTFAVADGGTLTITAQDTNLLSNDSDDVHVGNNGLRILPEPAQQPDAAAFFELGADGGFTYQAVFSNLREDQLDTFKYQLDDGATDVSTGKVTIRIVAINQAPLLRGEIPAIDAIEDEAFEVDLGPYFSDPEGGAISFSLSPDSFLPPSGNIELSSGGVLAGTPDADDVGSYVLTILASDGSLSTEAVVSLEIAAAPIVPVNSAPVFVETTVFDQTTFVGLRILPVEPVFFDPDGDRLTYSLAGSGVLPAGVRLNRVTGVISGTPSAEFQADNLRVRATDTSGASAFTSPFYIRVR